MFAVTKKERRRTRGGAAYLALELADASGRVEARIWNDVDLLDRRFQEGDAIHVLGRVESFGGKLQVQVRAVEPAEDADPASLTPSLRRDADELDGFFEFLASEISHTGLAALVDSFARDAAIRASLRCLPAAGAKGTTATPEVSSNTPSGSPRSVVRPPSSIPAFAPTFCSQPRSCTTWAGSGRLGQDLRFDRRTRAAFSVTSTSGSG